MSDNWELAYQNCLKLVYQEQGAFQASNCDVVGELNAETLCPTYGELDYLSLVRLVGKIGLNDQDVFVDLGSGAGKLILSLLMRTSLKTLIGVEALESYHQRAVGACQTLKDWAPSIFDSKKVEFILGNFLDFDFNQASVIYTCSTCFHQELMWLIGEKLEHSPSVRMVISLKPIANLNRMRLTDVIPVRASWDEALAFIYQV